MPEPVLHVVFGSGQIGPRVAEALLAPGHRVRIVRRSAAPVPAGVELVRGDALDAAFCAEAARGAAAVYHCINAPYFARTWEAQLPRFAENLARAAGGVGARLVVLDNLYMLGRPRGRAMNEDSPPAPVSRKGEIRARVAAWLSDAHRRGLVRVVTGRASDFYGPGGVGTYFGPLLWPAALRGRRALWLGNPDTPHTYHFIPDVARGLAALGTAADDVEGKFFMLPCASAESSRALLGRMSAALGREIRILPLPRPAVALLGLAVPILRELREMLYQWDEPFVVDDARFRARFPDLAPTDPDAGARETVAWALARFGSGQRATAAA